MHRRLQPSSQVAPTRPCRRPRGTRRVCAANRPHRLYAPGARFGLRSEPAGPQRAAMPKSTTRRSHIGGVHVETRFQILWDQKGQKKGPALRFRSDVGCTAGPFWAMRTTNVMCHSNEECPQRAVRCSEVTTSATADGRKGWYTPHVNEFPTPALGLGTAQIGSLGSWAVYRSQSFEIERQTARRSRAFHRARLASPRSSPSSRNRRAPSGPAGWCNSSPKLFYFD